MTDLPDQTRLLQAMDVTWAPAKMRALGPWVLRSGEGGGKRVSATTTHLPVNVGDIAQAETEMANMDQQSIFMLPGETGLPLDKMLADRGYKNVDPVILLACPVQKLGSVSANPHDGIPCEQPLALMRDIWGNGGIGPSRLQVMKRTLGPKTWLFGRHGQTPASVSFVALDGNIAMLHALEISPELRRKGIARKMISQAAIWAGKQGAEFIAVAVTSENTPACGLYTSLGMQVAGRYHYRMK
ncbi:MAG: GNAT superfamily N-acetyltransferase [Paracoccaceae bacterium]|jgi:GNAT superfamily N-acetyltransferase